MGRGPIPLRGNPNPRGGAPKMQPKKKKGWVGAPSPINPFQPIFFQGNALTLIKLLKNPFMNYQVHISIKSFDNLYIDHSITRILQINKYLQKHLDRSNQISLPSIKKKYTVLRSPHIDKKSREQFEWTRYKKSIFLQFEKSFLLSFFVFLLKNSSFPGVQVEINYKNLSFYNPL